MGIKDFTKVFEPQLVLKQSFEQFKGQSIIIDGATEVHRALRGMKSINGLTSAAGVRTQHINVIMCNILERKKYNIREAWVFDSKNNIYKKDEVERRHKLRYENKMRMFEIEQLGTLTSVEQIEKLAKYQKAATGLEVNDIDNVKYLLDLMGVPWVEAPKNVEAEKVCAELCRQDAYRYVLSLDTDSLVCGSPRVIMRKVSTTEKKLFVYDLEELLQKYKITQDELVRISIMLGTDFNKGGHRGIGAVTVLKKYKTVVLNESEEQIAAIFSTPIDLNVLEWHREKKNTDKLIEWLVVDLSFNRERVTRMLVHK